MIKTLFFDVGYTLINEDAVWRQRCREQAEEKDALALGLTPSDIMNDVLEATNSFKPQFQTVIDKHKLSRMVPYREEFEALYPEVKAVLENLSKKYRLGIIANQSKGLFDRLVKLGIAEYFEPELVISSSEKNLHKPDIRIFELALEKSGDSASESVMIGDRIDNDVKPAKQLGMKSIRIKRGIASSQQAPSAEYEADFTIRNLYELDGILDKMQRE